MKNVVLVAVLLIIAGSAYGQSRKGVGLSAPGSGVRIGNSGTVSSFSAYSYGLGGMRSGGGGDSGLLRSNIDGPGNMRVGGISSAGGGMSAGMMSMDPMRKPVSSMAGRSGMSAIPMAGDMTFRSSGGSSGAIGLMPTMNSNASVMSSAATLNNAAASVLGDTSSKEADVEIKKPVTTFVPAEPSLYHDYMDEGEQALKRGDPASALRKFEMAKLMAGKDPESLLNMTHASFLGATASYDAPAGYLASALEYLPELPLVPLKPKQFFGSDAAYAQALTRLEEHLKQDSHDAGGFLLLAYFRWFEGDIQAARTAITTGLAVTRNADMIEALSIFNDGMAASGKIPGSPADSTGGKELASPAVTTMPAAAQAISKSLK